MTSGGQLAGSVKRGMRGMAGRGCTTSATAFFPSACRAQAVTKEISFDNRLPAGNMTRRRTPLEYTLMCLMARVPSTGAQLVRLLRGFPLGGHGQSPGAVYPALRRLEAAGLVFSWGRPRREATAAYRERMRGRPSRQVKLMGLTGAGLEELRRWAAAPVTRADMLERPDYLLLRFSFLSGLRGPASLELFLREYAAVAKELEDDVERELRDVGADASLTARLALELSLDLFAARRRWARAARQQLTCAGATTEEAWSP